MILIIQPMIFMISLYFRLSLFFSKELLEYMNRNPLLRHELLVYLYKFKEEHKEKEEAAGAENGKILADR